MILLGGLILLQCVILTYLTLLVAKGFISWMFERYLWLCKSKFLRSVTLLEAILCTGLVLEAESGSWTMTCLGVTLYLTCEDTLWVGVRDSKELLIGLFEIGVFTLEL